MSEEGPQKITTIAILEGTVEKVAIRIALGNNGGSWATHYTDQQKALWRLRASEIIGDVHDMIFGRA